MTARQAPRPGTKTSGPDRIEPVDLRPTLAAEARVMPLQLLLAALATSVLAGESERAHLPAALFWAWLAALVLNASMRFLLASRHERSPRPLAADSQPLRWLMTSYLIDAILWLALFGIVWPFGSTVPQGALFAACGALVLGALTLRPLSGALLGWLTLWLLTFAVLFAADSGRTPGLMLGLPACLAAAAWLGLAGRTRATSAYTPPPQTLGPPTQFGPTRLGWNAAVRAIPTPIIVARSGRIIEINAAACQFAGVDQAEIIGKPVEEFIGVQPAGALDPSGPAPRELLAVQVRPLRRAERGEPWQARVRVVEPGRPESTIVISLTQPVQLLRPGTTHPATGAPAGTLSSGVSRGVLDDAQRLAEWVAGTHGRPWYRDETGHLHLPPEFKLPPATVQGIDANTVARSSGDRPPSVRTSTVAPRPTTLPGEPSAATMPISPAADGFPLAHLVVPAERAGLDARYRDHVRAGRTFDERLRLRNAAGGLRAVRVVCFQRVVNPSWPPMVIGVIAPTRGETAMALIGPAEVVGHLPALIWVVDAAGRIVHAHTGPGGDPRRWGLRVEPGTTPLWSDAIDFFDKAQEGMLKALRGAIGGRPTFDLLNHRTGTSGGRIALRSHVVPYVLSTQGEAAQHGVMVLDTIASAQELMENERLRRSKSQYKALVEASPSLIWAIDAQFRFTFLSKRACRETYGYSVGDLIGNPFSALLEPSVDQFATRQALEALRDGQALRGFEIVKRAKNGQRLLVSVSAATLKAPDGSFAGAIGMSVDMTGLKQRERRLSEALRIERMVLDSAGQAIAVVKDGKVARCNDAFVQLLRVEPAELARVPVVQYFTDAHDWLEICAVAEERRAADRAATREVRMNRRSRTPGGGAEPAWCQLTARSIAPGEYVLVLTDIDSIRRREEHALHDAQHDELTGLPNRRLFSERAIEVLVANGARSGTCAVIVIDLDGFKSINDMHGHRVGDAVLREIAARLARVMRPQDTVARRGGDEFAILMPESGGRGDIENIAERILREIEQPVLLAGGQVGQLSASMGIAQSPEHGRDLERLLQLADHAMYEAKVNGKNTWAFAAAAQGGATVTPIGVRALRGA